MVYKLYDLTDEGIEIVEGETEGKNEQLEIDKLVHQMYNLNEEDIKEVENWYFRRYPKLASVIEQKLKEKRL